MASVQISQHFRKNKWLPRKFGHFVASGCSQTHFCAFSMIWATFCTHQNHCYLCVLFSSQPQTTNFEQKLARSLHFFGFTFEVGGHIDRLECGQLRLLTGVKGRKFETSSTKDTTRYSREKWSAFTRLKFQLDNLVIKGLIDFCDVTRWLLTSDES